VIQLTAQTRILVAVDPEDFRKGIDGLCRVCREKLAEGPFRGTLFVFSNRRKTGVKILAYDGSLTRSHVSLDRALASVLTSAGLVQG
jgi:transposase